MAEAGALPARRAASGPAASDPGRPAPAPAPPAGGAGGGPGAGKPPAAPVPGFFEGVGTSFLETAAIIGSMGVLFGRVVHRVVRFDVDGREIVRNLYRMGVKSMPIVIVTALFTGAIMVIQAAPIVERLGAHGLLGWGAGFGILREIGPLLCALMVNGRVGANNTAELGTMVVTEQIDALRVLAIDPIGFLVAPRFLAMVVTLFVACVFADGLALVGASLTGKLLLNVEPVVFYNGVTSGLLTFSDVWHGLAKSIVFGVVVGLSSCQYGIGVTGGAPGVGRAVNATVVASAAGIFVVDYFVSFLLG
jgi:phospholipid/cholesterol/gamma-HCH transport system permease protein